MPLLESNRREFRKVLFVALEGAVKAGQLSRSQLFQIRLATFFRPTILDNLFDACCEQMASEGIVFAAADGSINWDAIAKFIIAVLPVIIEAILKIIAVL